MGLFGKSRNTDELMTQAESILAGKGMTGKLAKGFMGADALGRMNQGMESAREAQTTAALLAQGGPTVPGTVTSVADTGQLINYNPVVTLSVTLPGGEQVEITSVVSKLQIPRVGDAVQLMADPRQPGAYVYAGLAR